MLNLPTHDKKDLYDIYIAVHTYIWSNSLCQQIIVAHAQTVPSGLAYFMYAVLLSTFGSFAFVKLASTKLVLDIVQLVRLAP